MRQRPVRPLGLRYQFVNGGLSVEPNVTGFLYIARRSAKVERKMVLSKVPVRIDDAAGITLVLSLREFQALEAGDAAAQIEQMRLRQPAATAESSEGFRYVVITTPGPDAVLVVTPGVPPK